MAPKSPKLKCKKCGAFHGGSKSPKVCPDCYAKGHRRFTAPASTWS